MSRNLMRTMYGDIHVTGGGGCLIRNFGIYDKERIVFIKDICANAKGYERLAAHKLKKNGGDPA